MNTYGIMKKKDFRFNLEFKKQVDEISFRHCNKKGFY